MIYERWDVSVDKKWRLPFPGLIKEQIDTGEIVYFCERKDGCIEMSMSPFKGKGNGDFIINYANEVKKGKRILIPKQLRESTSFHFGRKVTVILKNNENDIGTYSMELWPNK
jgi:DNA-binding transcriptional regulator/RsmH inhibitor MraZ